MPREAHDLIVTTVAGAVNGTVMLSESKATVTFAHDGSETTSGSFTYTVSDGTATDTATVNITVTPVNDPPGAPTVTDQTATAGSLYTYQVPEVIDPDGDDITYDAFQGSAYNPLPDWLRFNQDTRTFKGTPRKVHVAEYEILVSVSDGQAAAREASFTLKVVLPPNRPPSAPALSPLSATEDRSFTYQVPVFTDLDEDTLVYSAALEDGGSLPEWLSFSATTRTFSGTPLEDDTPASHSIRVTATDDGEPPKSASATFTLTVVAVNDAPVAVNDTATVAEAGSVDIASSTLLANDSDAEGDDLSVTNVAGAPNGTVTLSEDKATVTYTHDGSETTSGSFTYTVSDGTATDTATVNVTVTAANDAPVAANDTATVAEGGSVDIAASTLLANDSDAEGDDLSVTNVADAVNGTVTLSEDKATVTYTHDGSETTSGSFTYTVSDGTATDMATVTITVTAANDPPVATDDTATVAEGGSVDIAASTLLANDSDAEGDDLIVTAVAGAVNGTVMLSESKATVTFAHDGSETSSGSFTYTVSDGKATDTATVNVTVTAANDAPVAVNDTATVAEAGSVDIAVSTLLANDYDAEGDDLVVTAVASAVNGTVTLSENKATVTYTHDGSETTSGSFTYTVSDGTATNPATVNVTVTAANDAPVAVNDTATVAEAGSVDIAASTLLANDSDAEGDDLSVTAVAGAVNGTVTLSEDKATVTYTHDGSETSPGSFTYTVSDGTATDSATVNITVTAANDAPVAVNDTATVAEGSAVDIAASTLLANDSDAEGDDLSVTNVAGAVNGTVTLSEDKATVTFTHDGSETTSGSFTYTVSDGKATDTATANITVTPVNDPPGALTVTDQTATAGSFYTYQVPEVIDPDGDDLTYGAFQGVAYNPLPDWLRFNQDTRTFKGTPRKVHVAEYEILVSVSDGQAAAREASFTLKVVLPPNRPPSAPALSPLSVTEDRSFTYQVPVFTDLDEDTLVYSAALEDGGSLPEWLSFSATTRTFSGTPLEDDTPASHSIRVTATDEGEPPKSASVTFTLTVAEVNDAPSTPLLMDQTAQEGQPFSYTFEAVADPENGSVTYTATLGAGGELPPWLSFDATSLTLNGTPGQSDTPAELEIRITATDDGDPPLGAIADFTLTVVESNGAPVAADDAATVAEGEAVSIPSADLLANDSDPNGDELNVIGVGDALYGTVVLSPDGSSVTYTHGGSENPWGSFIYTVGDGTATDTATVAVTVTRVNDPPQAPSVDDQTAIEDQPFTYRFAPVDDPEGDSVTYGAALADDGALPGWLSFNAESRTLSGTPLEADTPAALTIFVTATDDGEPSQTANAEFKLTVVAVNDPPAAPSVADQKAIVGRPFTYVVPAAFDPDSRTLSYAATRGQGGNPLPRWLRFDADARSFSGTPLKADVATHEIVVSVSDELHTSSAAFTLSVEIAANRPPVPPPLQSRTATEDVPFSFAVPQFTDPDGNTLVYSASTVTPGGNAARLPRWLAFEAATRVLSGTPREDDTPATLTIVVTATDDGNPPASAEVQFTLKVEEVNDAPKASAGADLTVDSGAKVTLDGSLSSDPEGGPLDYAWSQDGEPIVTLAGANSIAPSFVAPVQLSADVELLFTLVVTDAAGARSGPDTVKVIIIAASRRATSVVPVITIEAGIASVVEGQVASFRVRATPSPRRPIAIVMDVTGGKAYGVKDGQRDVFILPGDTLAILVLPTVDDDRDEPQGRIDAAIRKQPLYRLGAKSSAYVNVNDNDSVPSEDDREPTPKTKRSTPTPSPEATLQKTVANPPSFSIAEIKDMTFSAGKDVGLVLLPKATLGDGRLSYDLTPALPDGLRFDDAALTVSGVPAGPFARALFTFGATDDTGDRASLSFHITVIETRAIQPEASPAPTTAPRPTPRPTATPAPAPRPNSSSPERGPKHTPSVPAPATSSPSATPSPMRTLEPPAAATPTLDAEALLATAAAAARADKNGVGWKGWLVTAVLLGVTAAFGGYVYVTKHGQ